MAYQINKTSGALLVNLADGQVDVASTDIRLVKTIQDLAKQ